MITINLPWPPSVNRIWRQGKRKGSVYLDPKYKAWRDEADKVIMASRSQIGPMITGRFTAFITLDETMRRKNTDADNRTKCVLDALQRMRVIENDALADRVDVSWGAAAGVRVSIFPTD